MDPNEPWDPGDIPWEPMEPQPGQDEEIPWEEM